VNRGRVASSERPIGGNQNARLWADQASIDQQNSRFSERDLGLMGQPIALAVDAVEAADRGRGLGAVGRRSFRDLGLGATIELGRSDQGGENGKRRPSAVPTQSVSSLQALSVLLASRCKPF